MTHNNKRFIIHSVLLLLCCLSLGAKTTTYRVHTGDFSKLRVFDNMKVVYESRPDSAGYAVFTCDDKLADAFIFSMNGNTLSAHIATEYTNTEGLPVVHIYSNFLTYFESSSSARVVVNKIAACPEFTCRLIGNGQMSIDNIHTNTLKASLDTGRGTLAISGKCDKALLKLTGTGTINADMLACKSAICTVLGTGSIGCAPTDLLKLRGLGSTTVYYRGTPKKIVKAGLGKLEHLE